MFYNDNYNTKITGQHKQIQSTSIKSSYIKNRLTFIEGLLF